MSFSSSVPSSAARQEQSGLARLWTAVSQRTSHESKMTEPTVIDARNHCLREMQEHITHERVRALQNSVEGQTRNRLELWRSKTDLHRAVKKEHVGLSQARINEVAAVLSQIKDAGGHESIARCLDYDVEQLPAGALQLTTLEQYYDAGDLHSLRVHHKGSGVHVSEEILWHISRQLLAAVSYLHDGPSSSRAVASSMTGASTIAGWTSVLHSDIKPENVLLRSDARGAGYAPTVLLADFDTAIFERAGAVAPLSTPAASAYGALNVPGSSRSHAAAATRAQEVVGGTLQYAPPEWPAASRKGDVWGVGATLYFLATGCTPRRAPPKGEVGPLPNPAAAAPFVLHGATSSLADGVGAAADDINGRLPLSFSVSPLQRRRWGIDYASGPYSPAFTAFLSNLLSLAPVTRPTAREALKQLPASLIKRGPPKVPKHRQGCFTASWDLSVFEGEPCECCPLSRRMRKDVEAERRRRDTRTMREQKERTKKERVEAQKRKARESVGAEKGKGKSVAAAAPVSAYAARERPERRPVLRVRIPALRAQARKEEVVSGEGADEWARVAPAAVKPPNRPPLLESRAKAQRARLGDLQL
ncbi:MAG: hypothetical protein Q9162_001108 [Coniocarpon cinnabarinum]